MVVTDFRCLSELYRNQFCSISSSSDSLLTWLPDIFINNSLLSFCALVNTFPSTFRITFLDFATIIANSNTMTKWPDSDMHDWSTSKPSPVDPLLSTSYKLSINFRKQADLFFDSNSTRTFYKVTSSNFLVHILADTSGIVKMIPWFQFWFHLVIGRHDYHSTMDFLGRFLLFLTRVWGMLITATTMIARAT